MKKVLFTRFPLESRFGGAEVQTLSLMKGLGERGYEVEFLGDCKTLLRAVRGPRTADRMKELNIDPPPVTKWNAISFLWRKKGMKKKLIEALNAERGTLSRVFMLSLSEKLLLTEWCIQNNIKVIWVEHDKVGRWLKWNPWLPRLRKLSRLATTVTVSDLSRDIYLDMGWREEDVISIPNGVETRLSSSEAPSKELNREAPLHSSASADSVEESNNVHPRKARNFRIGCISRLTYDKGVDLLIEAIKDLSNVELEIVGNGPERNKLIKACSRCNIQKQTSGQQKIELVESIPNIEEFYNRIDCLVLPSRENDPFGLVIAEAMMRGIPTICTDACGISRHISSEDSIIVPAGSSNKIKAAITEIQKEEVLEKLSRNGEKSARERFSVERMVNQYINVIKTTNEKCTMKNVQ